MKSEVNMTKGQSYKTTSYGNEASISFGNTSGYVIIKDRKAFSLIYMTGTQSPEFALTEEIEKAMLRYFK